MSITNGPGKEVYPISSFTYLLVPEDQSTRKSKVMLDFLNWTLVQGHEATGQLGYAPLPSSVIERLREELRKMH